MSKRNNMQGAAAHGRRHYAVVLCAAAITSVYAFSAAALQSNSETSVAPASNAKPSNLKVLPKDISRHDLDQTMRGYKEELGVPCEYCHAQNADTKKIDYASDENPVKETARFMISMTNDINNKYLAQLGDRRYAEPFTCGNCHRGQVEPPAFERK